MGILNGIKSMFSKNKVTIGMISVTDLIEDKSKVEYASEVPAYLSAANKIYFKQYDEAIDELETMLQGCPSNDYSQLAGIHINLMVAYFRNRKADATYFDKSTHHAKMSMVCGHNTGYAAQRLLINLKKEKRYNQALEACNLLADQKYIFSKYCSGNRTQYSIMADKIKVSIEKHGDDNTERLFTDTEVKLLYQNATYDTYSPKT